MKKKLRQLDEAGGGGGGGGGGGDMAPRKTDRMGELPLKIRRSRRGR